MKRIGILTSGGDCAGLNAIIRAVTLRAHHYYGWKVIGLRQGTAGMLTRPIKHMVLDPNSGLFNQGLLRLGGTVLGTTNKGNPFAFPMQDGSLKDRSQEIIDAYHELELDAFIGIGGDGSHQILNRLAEQGKLNYVAIPKTIDNDLGCTENSIGFVTAVDVATEALDRLQPTAASHDRVMILEVMGRDAGHIALSAGIAGGADVILIPEIPYKLGRIAKKVQEIRTAGRNYTLIVVAEAVCMEDGNKATIVDRSGRHRYSGIGSYIGEHLESCMDAEVRVTNLGHVQRGGAPGSTDRILAAAFGVRAVDLIAQGEFGRMVTWQNRRVIDVPILEAIASYQEVDTEGALVQTARGLGISFGD